MLSGYVSLARKRKLVRIVKQVGVFFKLWEKVSAGAKWMNELRMPEDSMNSCFSPQIPRTEKHENHEPSQSVEGLVRHSRLLVHNTLDRKTVLQNRDWDRTDVVHGSE